MESQFSKQLINEITDYVDPVLKDFYERSKYVYAYRAKTLQDLITVALEENFTNADNAQLKYQNELQARRSRRKNWYDKTMKNRKQYAYADEKSYFHHIVVDLITKGDYYKEKYDTVDPDLVVNRICEDIEEWREKNTYLILFPNLGHTGRISVPQTFASDLFVNLYQVIKEKYNGSLRNWSLKSPYEFIANPMFSGQHGSAPVETTSDNQLVAKLFTSSDYSVLFGNIAKEDLEGLMDDAATEKKMPVLDNVDLELISVLINNASYDITSSSGLIPMQTITLSVIAQTVYRTKTPSKQQRDNIRERINRLTSPVEIRNQSTGQAYTWTILSAINIHKPDAQGQRFIDYWLGPTLSNAILENRVISISSSKYYALSDGYSRILYSQLQLERLSLTLRGGSMTNTYSYAHFVRILLLRSRSVQRNKESIRKALDGIIALGGLIEEYSISKSDFTVTFVPLTDEEKEELGQNDNLLKLTMGMSSKQ